MSGLLQMASRVLGQGRAGRPHRGGQLLPGLAELHVDLAQVGRQFFGKLQAGLLHGACGLSVLQDRSGLSCVDFLADPAGYQLAQRRLEPAGDLVAGPAQVPVPPGLDRQHRRVIIRPDQQAGS